MKPWRDLQSIAIPDLMKGLAKGLAKDVRGYPIPFTVKFGPDGLPDFRVVDENRWLEAVTERRCGICGGRLHGHVAFVGGPRSMRHSLFYDAAMHPGCARYAVQVCPFIAAPKFAYSRAEPNMPGVSIVTLETATTTRPDYFGLGITRGFTVVQNGPEPALKAYEWAGVEWWKEGVQHANEPK